MSLTSTVPAGCCLHPTPDVQPAPAAAHVCDAVAERGGAGGERTRGCTMARWPPTTTARCCPSSSRSRDLRAGRHGRACASSGSWWGRSVMGVVPAHPDPSTGSRGLASTRPPVTGRKWAATSRLSSSRCNAARASPSVWLSRLAHRRERGEERVMAAGENNFLYSLSRSGCDSDHLSIHSMFAA